MTSAFFVNQEAEALRTATYLLRIDRQQAIVQTDERFVERFGAGAVEAGRTLADALGAPAHAVLRGAVEAALGGTPAEAEFDLRAADGGNYRLLATCLPDRDASGGVCGASLVLADVSTLHRAERAVRNRERDIAAVVENAPDIIARLDTSLHFMYVNHAVEAAFNVRADDLTGKHLDAVGLPTEVNVAFADAVKDAMATGEERLLDFQLTRDDRLRHYKTRLTPQRGTSEMVESVLATTYDVTQRVETELERDALLVREKVARMQAEAAARARDQFLAVVSHELRSPLNGIQSWSHVLESYLNDDSPQIRRALAGIKTGVQQQVRLIEDLLDATQLTAGKMQLVRQPTRMQPVVRAAIARAMSAAEARHIHIETDFGAVDGHVIGDAERLEQVVWNLLSNAIKFSPEGGTVWVTLGNENGDAVITVRDAGRGIAADFLPYLFVPFRLADGSRTRRAGGIGLGLMLVRRLTEMHGGKVLAYSEGEDRGASFTVYLPLERKESVEGPSRSDSVKSDSSQAMISLEGLRVLLVDDQAEARDALQMLLQQAGARVTACDSGLAAVEFLDAVDPAERPNVLVCDIAMPGQDGYVTLQQIRQQERERPELPRLPAIALTAFTQREDKIRVLSSGFQMHLAKPADAAELISLIDMLARHGADVLSSVEG